MRRCKVAAVADGEFPLGFAVNVDVLQTARIADDLLAVAVGVFFSQCR